MPARKAYTIMALLFVVCVILFRREQVYSAYELISMNTFPDSARAVAYGQRHFDSSNPGAYDVKRAEHFFTKAHEMDTHNPMALHELARIRFLHGQFDEAISLINEAIAQGGEKPIPSSYYVRGLIYGFKGDTENAVADYRTYLRFDSSNWAAANDLAWVLLKGKRPREALAEIDRVLPMWPNNPWLLNSYSIALHELGENASALSYGSRASAQANTISTRDWLRAYPGNDPKVATDGIIALKSAIAENIADIELALQNESVR